MYGNIVMKNGGGIYPQDGNVYINAQGYSNYLNEIFNNIYSLLLIPRENYSDSVPDIFSIYLNDNHKCWNKLHHVLGEYMDNSPSPDYAEWWEVLTCGINTRAFQLAFGCYDFQRSIYIRFKHDGTWSGWYTIPFVSVEGDVLKFKI